MHVSIRFSADLVIYCRICLPILTTSLSLVYDLCQMSDLVLQEYEVKDNKSTVAVTAGNKAFIFWRVCIYILSSI